MTKIDAIVRGEARNNGQRSALRSTQTPKPD